MSGSGQHCSSPRRWEGGGGVSEYTEVVEGLEEAEQLLIEHLRTAGIKKTRECQLIDELLSIRKRRRQVVSLLSKEINNIKDYYEEQRVKMRSQMSQMKERIIDLTNKLDGKDHTLKNIEIEFKKKVDDLHVKYREAMKGDVMRVRESYEKKLSILENKVSQVQQETRAHNKQDEEDQARRIQVIVEENAQRQHEKYISTMERYKSALRSLAEKEKSLKDICEQRAAQVHSVTVENKRQQELVSELTQKLAIEKEKAMDKGSYCNDLERRLSILTRKYKQLESSRDEDIISAKSISDDAISSIHTKHAQELKLVDEKVRQALQKKDDIIVNLQSQIDRMQTESKEAAILLDDLNRNIKIRQVDSK